MLPGSDPKLKDEWIVIGAPRDGGADAGSIYLFRYDEAIGTWYLYDDLHEFRRGMRLFGTAFYRDRYVRVGDEWKIIYSQFHRIYEIKEELPPREAVVTSYLETHGHKHEGEADLEPFPKDNRYRHPPGKMPPFLDYR